MSITLRSRMNFRVTSALCMRFFLIILIYSLKMFTSPTERLQKMKFSTIAGSMNRRLNSRADWMCSCLESDGPDISDLMNRAPCGKRSEEHTSELQSRGHLVCRLLLEKKTKEIILSNKCQQRCFSIRINLVGTTVCGTKHLIWQ